jgi:hypothetical protein
MSWRKLFPRLLSPGRLLDLLGRYQVAPEDRPSAPAIIPHLTGVECRELRRWLERFCTQRRPPDENVREG